MATVITIDGPSASGKTSVSRELARRLGWKWVSTGAFYRGLAYTAQQMKTNLQDEEALASLAQNRRLWRIEMTDEQTKVFFQDQDVTELTNSEDVGSIASKISHFPKVRAALLDPQRDCAKSVSGLVAEGRDCGTVVFPAAKAKVYLTASQVNRAERRAREQGLSAAETVEAQKVRDRQDSTRKAAPLQIPEEAFVLDSTDLELAQVVDQVEKFVREKMTI